jgi:hypothetical protein
MITTFQISSTLSQYHVHLDYQPVLPVADSTRAIFLISMGRQAAESKIVERFLMSTRRRGSWNGHVVLLTDAPTSRYQHLQDQDDHFLVMNPRPEHFNWETKHDMPYKRFKTFVLDYVDSDPRLDAVQLVYYLDVDIVIGNTLWSFFDDVESLYNISSVSKEEVVPAPAVDDDGNVPSDAAPPAPPPSNIYFFKGNFAKTPVQGGQIVMERDSSRNCLLWWRSMMDTQTSETKDQPFLKVMQEHNHNNSFHCHITVMDQDPHLTFPSAESVKAMTNHHIFPFVSPLNWNKDRYYATLLHIKNTGKVRKIDEDAETTYIRDVLNLRFWDSNADVGRKMHFDPDEPPWSPNHANSSWTPTYAQTNETVEWLTRSG